MRFLLAVVFSLFSALATAQTTQVTAKVTTAAPTYPTGTFQPFSLDTSGALRTSATSSSPGTGATNLGKAEDAPHSSGDVGVATLGVQTATPVDKAAEGDYAVFEISAGRLWTSATIDAALPAGTNSIGKLGANSGVTIGDVNVISSIPGIGATNLGKAEDAAHVSSDTGVMALGVRTDTLSTPPAGTDGDYIPFLTDSRGAVWVAPSGNVASDGVDSGNPVKIGCKYTATAVAVSDLDRVDVRCGPDGSIFAVPGLAAVTPVDGVTNANSFGQAYGIQTGLTLKYPITGTLIRGDTGTWNTAFNCTNSAVVNVTAGNTTELIALTASQVIRVCSFAITESLAGTAAFVYGTGTNCATGQASLTGAMQIVTGGDIAMSAGNSSLFRTASANALCLTAVTGNITGFVSYAKY